MPSVVAATSPVDGQPPAAKAIAPIVVTTISSMIRGLQSSTKSAARARAATGASSAAGAGARGVEALTAPQCATARLRGNRFLLAVRLPAERPRGHGHAGEAPQEDDADA